MATSAASFTEYNIPNAAGEKTKEIKVRFCCITPGFVKNLSFLHTILSITLGIVQVSRNGSWHLTVPRASQSWLEDINKYNFRHGAFTLNPEVLSDYWGPLLTGIFFFLQHYDAFCVDELMRNFSRLGLLHIFVGLFGNLGYSGWLGIGVGCYSVFVAILCFVLGMLTSQCASKRLSGNNMFYCLGRGLRRIVFGKDRDADMKSRKAYRSQSDLEDAYDSDTSKDSL